MTEVVVGIELGSTSGFAYSLFNKDKIFHGNINRSNLNNKVPTEIILDDHNYTIGFGEECKRYLIEKGLKIGHYFKDIKIQLYENKSIIEAKNSGKKLPL